ncbi:MAG: hypothetical protein KGJ23_15065 [Euryarchaeota archaeon]|nr:hypothetical protein [Euryarchaeota archaeon]MDE1880164.1 hypothetical protein [Euryarchaeota archaeon]MDE2045380.1 hypothetical protein [Thermoplasmata archaeon]
MPFPALLLFAEMLFLPAMLVPFGDLMVWIAERALGVRPTLSLLERVLVSFYAAGGILFTLSYVPMELFLRARLPFLLVGLGAVGWAAWGARGILRRGDPGAARAPLLASGRWILGKKDRVPVLLVGLLFLFLLGFEILLVGSRLLPNSFDGSVQTDFVSLLLSQGNSPRTLEPIAPMGVVYPQGSAVWFGSATALFGWSVPQSPVLLPPLFMALSVPAFYGWGARLFGPGTASGREGGLIFAAGGALLLSWPRFLVGGSYDFLFAIPLFLVMLGWYMDPTSRSVLGWRAVALLGLGVGVMASLSPVPAEFLVAFVAVSGLARHPASLPRGLWAATQALPLAGFGLLFSAPSLGGMARWWNYPGHILAPGGGPSPPTPPAPSATGTFIGLTDPFLFRPQDVWLSPFPLVKVEIAVLLFGGLLLVLHAMTRREPRGFPPRAVSVQVSLGMGVGIALIGLGTLGGVSSPIVGAASAVTSVGEISIILFLMYGALALLPMIAAWKAVMRLTAPTRPSPVADGSNPVRERGAARIVPGRRGRKGRPLGPGMTGRLSTLTLALILVVPMVTAGAETLVGAQAFYGDGILHPLSNDSDADISMLQWAAASLPVCSGVLVAPGSAGQFLPGYAPDLRVVFPMNPGPQGNFSYERAVSYLSSGNYTAAVRADLVALGVTEVMVTPRTNILWRAFAPESFTNSSLALQDFTLVYFGGSTGPGPSDMVFAFGPGGVARSCPLPPAAPA